MRMLASDTGVVDAGERRRVPGDGDVHVVERAVAHHERLCRAALLGRAAVVAHAALRCRSPPASPSPRSPPASRRRRAGCGRSRGPCRRRAAARCSATPASWLRPGSASYSPRMAITGPPSPASPITAVGMPAMLVGDAEALRAPASPRARRPSAFRGSRSPACPRRGRSARRILALGVDQRPDRFGVLHGSFPRLCGGKTEPGGALRQSGLRFPRRCCHTRRPCRSCLRNRQRGSGHTRATWRRCRLSTRRAGCGAWPMRTSVSNSSCSMRKGAIVARTAADQHRWGLRSLASATGGTGSMCASPTASMNPEFASAARMDWSCRARRSSGANTRRCISSRWTSWTTAICAARSASMTTRTCTPRT